MVIVLYKEDLASARLEVLVGSRTQDPYHLFSGARVVIAHKQNFMLSLNKSIHKSFKCEKRKVVDKHFLQISLLVVL